MSFSIPIEQDVDIAISGSTINIPAAVTSSGDVGILRQAATRDLFVTGTLTTNQGTSPWIVSSTNLDIRDLDYASDDVTVYGDNGVALQQDASNKLIVIDTDVSGAIVSAQNVLSSAINTIYNELNSGDIDIRNLNSGSDSVTVAQGTNPWTVSMSGSVTIAGYGDNPGLDAFGRLRVSNPTTLFESKQIFDNQDLYWSTTASNGQVTYIQNEAATLMSVSGTNGAFIIKQSRQRMNYQPGKSLVVMGTYLFDSGSSNIVKRFGYFDNSNGLFFEQSGSNLNICLRTNTTGTPTTTQVSQSSWNLDRLDGSGSSGITLDITKAQISFFDFEWLGVGRVRAGFVFNGQTIYVHEFNRANTLTKVYMSTPNLPIRYEIRSLAAGSAATLKEICSTALSEGGLEILGTLRTANRGTSKLVNAANGVFCPVISIRLKSTNIGATIYPTDISLVPTAADTFLWALILNPTVAGVDAASWVSLSNSAIEYDISRTIANTLTGGTVIKSGYVSGQGVTVSAATIGDLKSSLLVSADVNNVPDQLVLAVMHIGGSTMDYYGSLSWREIF